MGVLVFLTLAGFLGLGVIWFFVLRPMLEDYGLVTPREASSVLTTTPARVLSSATVWDADDLPIATNLAATATTPATPIATPATDSNDLLLRGKAEALAALVLAGKVTETEGIKIVYGVSASGSNPRYLEVRDLLKAELKRQAPPEVETPIAGRRTRAQFR